MSRPLPLAFLLVVTGILSAYYINISFPAIIGSTSFFFIFFLFFGKRHNLIFYIVCGVLTFLLGALSYVNYTYLADNHVSRLLKGAKGELYIEGVVVSPPEYRQMRWAKKASFIFRASGYKKDNLWIQLSGLSKVNIKDTGGGYSYGDRLVLLGSLKRPAGAANPGEFDYAAYLKRKRIYTIIEVKSDDDIRLLDRFRPAAPLRFIFLVRENIERLISNYLPPTDASVINAMLIGIRGSIPEWLNERFVETGTAHILSVSGLHVVIISSIVFFILRYMRIPRKPASVLIILFLAAYTILAGARAPILRATIMITVYLLGYIWERDFDVYSALSMAGIIILLAKPMEVFDAGFLLSFACVFSLCYFTPRIEPALRIAKVNPFMRYMKQPLIASFAVYIGVMPMLAYYFNIICPITILANLFIIPLSSIIMFVAILFIISAGIAAPITAALAFVLHSLVSVFIKIILFLSSLPFGYSYLPDMPLYTVFAYYILLFAAVKAKTPALNWVRVAAVALFFANILIWQPLFFKGGRLKVAFLDTRERDTSFIEFPDGRCMLINAGIKRGPYYDEGKRKALPFIWSRGRGYIDFIFLADSDAAHIGSLASLLEKIGVGYIISAVPLEGEEWFYRRLSRIITLKRIEVVRLGDALEIRDLGGAKVIITAPSTAEITYKNADFFFSPQKNALYLKGKPQIILLSEGAGATGIVTDGKEYSVFPLSKYKI